MASSYRDLIQKGKSQRNALDSFMGFFGKGVDNENYVPGRDLDGNVKGLTLGERFSGISMDEKRAANARIQQRQKEELDDYKFLKSEGVAPELSADVTDTDLAKATRDFKDVRTAEVAAREVGVDAQKIAELKNSGLGSTAISSSLYNATRKQKGINANEAYTSSPQYLDAKNEQDYRRTRERIADDRLAFDREQAAQLRSDSLIESKEARIGQQEMQMLQLNRDERLHNSNLEYKRELDEAARRDNIAAALSSLAMSFFA